MVASAQENRLWLVTCIVVIMLFYGAMHVPFMFLVGVMGFVSFSVALIGQSLYLSLFRLTPVIILFGFTVLLWTISRWTHIFSLYVFNTQLNTVYINVMAAATASCVAIRCLAWVLQPLRRKLGDQMIWVWSAIIFAFLAAGLYAFGSRNLFHLSEQGVHAMHGIFYALMYVFAVLFSLMFGVGLYSEMTLRLQRIKLKQKSDDRH